METSELQALLGEPVTSCKALNSMASDVWLVKTESRDVIVRTSAIDSLDIAPWPWGCHDLFGVDVRQVSHLKEMNETLRNHTDFLIPQVVNIGIVGGKTVAAVEKLNGTQFSLRDQTDVFVVEFGRRLAQLHQVRFEHCGNMDGHFSYKVSEFHQRMARTMVRVADRFYSEDAQIQGLLPSILDDLRILDSPAYGTFIMLDMDQRQFIAEGQDIACVDTEGYAVGPRELDLVALEYSLDAGRAQAFRRGYESVLALPALHDVRAVYRYLYRLFQIKGPVDVTTWMEWPAFLTC